MMRRTPPSPTETDALDLAERLEGESFEIYRGASDGPRSAQLWLKEAERDLIVAALRERTGASGSYAEKFPTDPKKRYDRLLQSFTELQAAAQKVVDETDRIHDGDPWPLKYRAPYGAITELRQLLGRQYGLRSPLPAPPPQGAEDKR